MASTLRTIVEALGARLATIDGTGDYDHDLSGPGQVVIGRIADDPPVTGKAAACVWVEQVETQEEGIDLSYYYEVASIGVRVWAPSTDRDDAVLEAIDLGRDVKAAIRADESLGGVVANLDLRVREGQYLNEPQELGAWGVGDLLVEARFETTGGG